MAMAGPLWPSRDEYDVAVARWNETLGDPELRNGRLDFDHLGIRRYGGANLYVCIYRISDWMMRCFCASSTRQPPADICEHYSAIDQFSHAHVGRVSALVPVSYIERGITVGTRILPIVKMPFLVNCPSLGEYIMDYYQDQAVMQRLCAAWLLLSGELETASMAHGDLDLSNVLVEQQGEQLRLRLIDYDNTWIAPLAGHEQTEHGHQHFQHPAFMPPHARPYNADMDRFSMLVIYLSLRALAAHPNLYDDWGADESERLLFSDMDYRQADLAGSRIGQLRNLSTPDLHPYIDELCAALREAKMPGSLLAIAQMPANVNVVYRPVVPPGQLPRPAAPPPPARALWKEAVYNANAGFILRRRRCHPRLCLCLHPETITAMGEWAHSAYQRCRQRPGERKPDGPDHFQRLCARSGVIATWIA